MNESVDWQNIKYNEIFEEELRGLERRRNYENNCSIKDLEAVLDALYIMDGADGSGRGDVQDISMAATIAAYEHFIAQWKTQKVCPQSKQLCGQTLAGERG